MTRYPRLTFWRSAGTRDWHWTLRATNGTIINASTEGFKRKAGAIGNFQRVQYAMATALWYERLPNGTNRRI